MNVLLSGAALDVNRAAVQPHQLLDQREPNAGAFIGSSARPFHAMEAFKRTWKLGFWYPCS